VGGLDLFPQVTAQVAERAWSVLEVTTRARRILEEGMGLVWVRGEVTGFKAYRSGHWYFTLRDAQAQVRCVMWQTDNQRLPAAPTEGMQVYVAARPTVWEERGELRLTVKQMVPTQDGGTWQRRLEQAKEALRRDGLLDPARKRPLPSFPTRIAMVTSIDGAAVRDVISVMRRRWPLVTLFVLPTRVQGDGSEREICAALELAARIPDLHLLIIGRGGGSREDLWAFNSEAVARAVAAAPVPTISAVGHETDVSLTDLVADACAPTPSAAAEAAVPDRAAVGEGLAGLARHLAQGLTRRTAVVSQQVERMSDRLQLAIETTLERSSARIARAAAGLDALSPLRVLQRGYAVARSEEGKVLKQVAQFTPGLSFRLTVTDGGVPARVADASPRGPHAAPPSPSRGRERGRR
jgi:exodeoxyribonuclease VII large subunit